MGVIRGIDPKQSTEVVLLTAHLDHLGKKRRHAGDNIYNGADDDASGVTAVLEMARAIGAGQNRNARYTSSVSAVKKSVDTGRVISSTIRRCL